MGLLFSLWRYAVRKRESANLYHEDVSANQYGEVIFAYRSQAV
jgi:hypothetical protein